MTIASVAGCRLFSGFSCGKLKVSNLPKESDELVTYTLQSERQENLRINQKSLWERWSWSASRVFLRHLEVWQEKWQNVERDYSRMRYHLLTNNRERWKNVKLCYKSLSLWKWMKFFDLMSRYSRVCALAASQDDDCAGCSALRISSWIKKNILAMKSVTSPVDGSFILHG